MIPYLLSLLVFSVVAISSAGAESAEIKPGAYVDGGYGWLTIQKNKKNELMFEIESWGANGHSCGVSGVIRNGIGHADRNKTDPECLISFSAKESTIVVDVDDNDEQTFYACRRYCGMRAGFTGTYVIPPAACTKANRQAERDRFLALYRARQYSEAANTLEELISQCSEFMHWIESSQVRSDLALAQYHNHDAAKCLETLNATLAGKVKNEKELEAGNGDFYLPPIDFESYIKVAKAIWFNKALCAKAMQKGAVNTCPVTEQKLTGDFWARVGNTGFFEEFRLEIDSSTRTFTSWLHHRPELFGATWAIEDCHLVVTPQHGELRTFRFKIRSLKQGKLRLYDEDDRTESVYRRVPDPDKS
jgi:hypothetical protein